MRENRLFSVIICSNEFSSTEGEIILRLSSRAQRLLPSATLTVVSKAKALKREGKPVISFGAGEPDFNSPDPALKYALEAMQQGKTHYTPGTGIPELKEAVSRDYAERFNLLYSPEQIIIGAGAKPLIYEALGCLVEPGDEVVLFTPAWVSYLEQIRLFGGEALSVDTKDNRYIPDIHKFRSMITPRTRCMIINSPNNPTGAVYDRETLKGLAEIAIEKDMTIIFDEIYERLVYGDARHHEILQVCPEVSDRTLIINGVSKAYAMTGWRIGYALGPQELISKMGAYQGHLTSNPCSIAQWAALGAIEKAENDISYMRGVFAQRRNLILELLRPMPLIRFEEPQGAFYVWINIQNALGRSYKGSIISDDNAFCSSLLENMYVAAVPGNAFMSPGHIRISYSNSEEEIREGMKRLSEFLEDIS